jgi:hypothetical protein
MERNGLEGRKREFKVGNWVGGISTFFLISFFLVPAYLPTDSVPDLSGRANMFDYGYEDSWGICRLVNRMELVIIKLQKGNSLGPNWILSQHLSMDLEI